MNRDQIMAVLACFGIVGAALLAGYLIVVYPVFHVDTMSASLIAAHGRYSIMLGIIILFLGGYLSEKLKL